METSAEEDLSCPSDDAGLKTANAAIRRRKKKLTDLNNEDLNKENLIEMNVIEVFTGH